MRVKRIKSDSIFLHENSKVRLKTCGTCREIQFTGETNGYKADGKQAIINKETGQIIDFYEGTSLKGFINVRQVQ